ncbi:hypothetical protein RI367_006340 [Sorochytrium milnesiophthora]
MADEQSSAPIFTPLSADEMDMIENASPQKHPATGASSLAPPPATGGPSSYSTVLGSSPLRPSTSSAARSSSPVMATATAAGPTSISGGRAVSDTLDEPVSATIMRDLRAIWQKLKRVCFPKGSQNILKDWDLWGPLLLCLTLSITLSFRAPADQTAEVFTSIFVIVWCGAAVVTINSKLLGGKMSLFQSLCVLGYCTFPLCVAALVAVFVHILFIRAIVVLAAFLWSTMASVGFLSDVQLHQRRLLAIYPVCLFYFVIGWMVLIS